MNDIDTFPASFPNPDYGLTGTPTFEVDKMKMGDRYTRRIKKGINNKYYTWNLTWNNLSEQQLNEVVDFIEGLEGVHPFLWTHPTLQKMFKVICEEFSINQDVFERYNFTATFEEEL